VAARGQLGLCIRHGGGKCCQVTDCTKSAKGYTCLYISHGGGRKLLTALKVLKATHVFAFHMVVVASKTLSLFRSVFVSLDFFSRIL